jgi:hypothetical protein
MASHYRLRRFTACFFAPDGAIYEGDFWGSSDVQARRKARRIAERNGWQLVRVMAKQYG